MKRFLLAMAILMQAAVAPAQVKDDDGHTLVSLWKTYYKAVDADLPQDQLAALEVIKREAAAKRLAWDWYDAASRYVQVRININWKDRDDQRKAMNEELMALDEPVMVFYAKYNGWSADESIAYVKDNESRLKATFNPEFHARDSRINSQVYSPALKKLITNDYEYALWSLYLGRRGGDLEDYYEDRYPEEALIEYTDAVRWWDKSAYDRLGIYAKEYEGKAVSLLARQRRLEWEFSQLNNAGNSKSKDYKNLRAACEQLEKDRKKFTGSEKLIADCCTEAASLIKALDSKSIGIDVRDDKLTLTLRNISSLKLQVMDDEKVAVVWDTSLTNKQASYYVIDTLRTNIPDLNDGRYTILCKSGDCESTCAWVKHSLSIAARQDSKGWGIFVADYMTGEPVKSCDLQLLDADGKVIMTSPDFRPDGFTLLPEQLSGKLNDSKGRFRLQAKSTDKNGTLRQSGPISISKTSSYTPYEGKDVDRAILLTDRGAFNPGETVQFKAVCYTGTYEYRLAPQGRTITVTLTDPQGKEVAGKSLVTNEFGSAGGSFTLNGTTRGGQYTLNLKYGDASLARRVIRVDEFVLPTFELIWDEDKNLYMPGDVVKVSGKVKAYSGHSLGSAPLRYRIGKYEGSEISGEITLAPDGSFAIEFPAPDNSWTWTCPVTVTVTDGTGETLDFSTYRTVYNSVPLSLYLQNKVPGTYTLCDSGKRNSGSGIVRDSAAEILFSVRDLKRNNLTISYKVISDSKGKQIAKGTVQAGETLNLPVANLPSGLYRVEAVATAISASGTKVVTEQSTTFIKAADTDTSLDMDVLCFFKEMDAEDIALQIGSTDGPVWAVVELFGSGNELLDSQIIKLEGVRGKAGSLKTVSYTRKKGWPESLRLCALFFHKGKAYKYSRSIQLPEPSIKLPLEFTRFSDSARPGEEFSLLIKTAPGVECAATVFDKATETIVPNRWRTVTLVRHSEPSVYYSYTCGENGNTYPYYNTMMKGASLARADMVMEESAAAPETDDSVPFQHVEEAKEPEPRDNFAATMAWEPFLRSDADGNVELKLKGSDRLSTYYVQVFAHGEGMHNASLRKEMQVTIPVKLSLMEPKYLYENDWYVARATVASTLQKPVSGRVAIRFCDGNNWRSSRVLATKMESVNLSSGGTINFSAGFTVPEGIKELGVLLNFVPDDESDGADAMFVSIPVYRPLQTLTEAHSALLRDYSQRAKLVAGLRSSFVNMDASGLEPQERSILEMIREAIPDKVEPKGKDVMSLTEAWYANVLARRLGAPGLDDEALQDLKGKIAVCQNAGGGIAWFEGMESSPILTASVLQRIYAMPESSSPINVEKAVKYLDDSWFTSGSRPWWCGGISLEKYLQTRAMFPEVPFEAGSGKALKQFKKEVKDYLTPSGKRGLNGQILAKARRLRTLQLLSQSAEGVKLAKAWGITIKKRLLRSLEADIKSLLQYAVEHRSGGYYYPNAVMPWRGLLESELYAHSLLCDLLTDVSTGLLERSDRGGVGGNAPRPLGVQGDSFVPSATTVAEGIRLWLMVQKETQHWETDASYIEAIASVLRGTPETLDTRVIVLSGSYTKPFADVKASGNGFTVKCKWYKDNNELETGDMLHVGDKVTARYSIWSEENRSFVRISAPRPASFRPVHQLSGHYGWWLSPISYGGWNFSPQGYRNVLADKTEYWFDSYPEENTTVTEEFYVTQEGAFQVPAIEIESLYAPHYRANGEGRGPISSVN